MSKRTGAVVVGVITALLAGCDSGGEEPAAPGASATAPAVVQGKFDVGGHSLYLSCKGSGAPAVIYLHGSIKDAAVVPHHNGENFQNLLVGKQQVCVYDRRNVGLSDQVDGPQLPADALTDMRKLLAAGGIKPPYVLVGASFGGMLAYLYANEHPAEVTGMVLLDAMFPDEFTIENLVPVADRFQASDQEDETTSVERISHYKVQLAAQPYIGKEPKIPVTYFVSKQDPYTEDDLPAEWNDRILKLQAAYVARFSPGRMITVDAPHFMEPVVPDQIAAAVRELT